MRTRSVVMVLDRPGEAVRYFESFWQVPVDYWPAMSQLRPGTLNPEIGEPDGARDAYERFLASWTDAEPELPQLSEARAGLEALSSQ